MSKATNLLSAISEAIYPPETKRYFFFKPSLFEDMTFSVSTISQNPERSYEDRSVYIEFEFTERPAGKDKDGKALDIVTSNFHNWLDGEKAIELGLMLADAGRDTLDRNRLHSYEIIELLAASVSAQRGNYEKVIITRKSPEQPEGYGGGYYYHDLLYKAKDDLYSRHIKDVAIYWSPFKKEFKEQLKNYVYELPYELVGFSYDEIAKEFAEFSKEFNN